MQAVRILVLGIAPQKFPGAIKDVERADVRVSAERCGPAGANMMSAVGFEMPYGRHPNIGSAGRVTSPEERRSILETDRAM